MTHRVTFTHTRPDSGTKFYAIDENNVDRPTDADSHDALVSLLAAASADGRIESTSGSLDGNTFTGVINYRDEAAMESVKNDPAAQAYDTALAAYNSANGITVTAVEETV